MRFGSAHSASFPLYETMIQLLAVPVWEATAKLERVLKAANLESDVEVVIVMGAVGTSLSIEARSTFGEEVVRELESRTDFDPCPPGECEFEVSNTCKWCGRPGRPH